MKRVSGSFGRKLLFFLMIATLLLPGFEDFSAKVSAADCPAGITLEVTQGSPDVVSGTVTEVDTADVWVVWYIQPYADERAYLTVNADGTRFQLLSSKKGITRFPNNRPRDRFH